MANFSIMRNIIKGLFILLLVLVMGSCSGKQGKQISAVIPIAENKPDSALSILNKIDQIKLSDKNLALYSLVYTMAQDKSGFDVDNDSLLRNAYNWYKDKPTDSLYAKCEYYMGKYYSLNDSSEKALVCFSNCIKTAKKQNDFYTQSMALTQSSRIVREYAPDSAIYLAKEAIDIYNKVEDGTIINKVYSLLNLAECYIYGDKYHYIGNSKSLAKKAIELAKQSKDSITIADAYQDLSVFYGIEDNDSAIFSAKTSFAYRPVKDVSAIFSLSESFYQMDSLQKAKSLLLSIPMKDREKYGAEIYGLLRLIALKENDCIRVSQYADSSEAYLERNIANNLKIKDDYYSLLTQKEIQSADYRSNSIWKTRIIIIATFLFSIILVCVVCIYKQRQRKIKDDIKVERKQHKAELEHKEIQILTMRNFLIRKVDIINKIKSLTNNKEKVLLSNDDWEEIEVFLNTSDDNFVYRLKSNFTNLSIKDVRFLMLLRLKMPNSSLAKIYNIEEKSIRQNLFLIKKKLKIDGKDISARKFIETF